jgi:hypothetical protein
MNDIASGSRKLSRDVCKGACSVAFGNSTNATFKTYWAKTCELTRWTPSARVSGRILAKADEGMAPRYT